MATSIQVKTKEVRFDTAPNLYGLFFEDINRAADGGLYPEMLRNRAFEDSIPPADCQILPEGNVFLNEGGWPGSFVNGEGMDEWAAKCPPTPIPAWYVQNAQMELDRQDTLNQNRLAALDVTFAPGGFLYNIGYDGISVKAGSGYHFYLFAISPEDCDLEVCLYSMTGICFDSGRINIAGGDSYERYDLDLCSNGSEDKVQLRFGIPEGGRLKIAFTSLMPQQTFKDHGLREDLCKALKQTNSKFLRFPGGCVVEGINEANALTFSRSIGPVWERPSCFLMWHYRTSNGLGYHEYLQLCEDLEMSAMYVCNCGISCQARHGKGFASEVVDSYLEEALHAAEYALGGTDTKYGKMRADAGHPDPFPLEYLEIGNENFGPDYNPRYEKFYKAIRAAYPQLKLIANAHVERDGLEAQMVDEHYYNTPEYFVENKHLFDDYDRKGPEIFIGEYAVNGGSTIASLECALAEAVFLTGVEKNQDIVRLSAYAPLFQNSNYTAWLPNLIVFDQTRVYGIPSYHAISLMAKYRGSKVISSVSDGDVMPPKYAGIPGIICEKEGLLFKNASINGEKADISRKLYGDVESVGDGFRMIQGDRRHRYIGKNEEWNTAFEKFIGAGPEKPNPVLWMAFGTERMESSVFEIDLKFSPDNPVTLSVWNHDPQTDVGCNEPRDTDWNIRSVRNQIWKIADGKTQLRAPHFFDPPLHPEEVKALPLDYDSFHHFKMETEPGSYRCYLDGELIWEKKLALLPLVSEVATMDEGHIYLKLVNIGEKAQDVNIRLDCHVASDYTLEQIQGRPEDVNSFAEPERVCAREISRSGADSDFTVSIPAYSINVLKMKRLD